MRTLRIVTPFLMLVVCASVSAAQSAARRQPRRPTPAPGTVRREYRPPVSQAKMVTVAGMVVDADGKPAPGVRVFIQTTSTPPGVPAGVGFKALVTDASGRFKDSTELAGHLDITALVPGHSYAWRRVQPSDKDTQSLRLQLRPGLTLTGRLVRLDGRPAHGVAVRVSAFNSPTGFRGDSRGSGQLPVDAAILPALDAAQIFSTETNAAGQFCLKGLPKTVSAHLELRDDLVLALKDALTLAPGSVPALELGESAEQDAGILVAVRPARVRVQVTDRATGKPAAGVQVNLIPAAFPSIPSFGSAMVPGADQNLITGEDGTARGGGLIPGDYWAVAQGQRHKLSLREGQAAQLELSVRTGPLKLRVMDPAGKPVAGAAVSVPDATLALFPEFASFAALMGGGRQQGAGKTGPDGRLEVAEFPWEAESLTVEATRGNDRAVWKGKGSEIGGELELRLQPGVLISIAGRLVNPDRRPLRSTHFSLIRWQDTPRLAWFLNARNIASDREGRFRIHGLPRGEAFSMVSGGPFGMGPGGSGFEGPRFVTERAGRAQELGDVVVHPLDGGEQVLQLYGIESPEQLARLIGFLPPPGEAAAEAAARALSRYDEAIRAADLDAALRLTSPLSFGWSEDRASFLLISSLRPSGIGAAPEAALRPLRFMPRILPAYLMILRNLPFGLFSGLSFGAAAREIDANPDWAFLARREGETVRLRGILRREQGEWRLISLPDLPGLSDGLVLSIFGSGEPDAAGFDRVATLPDPAQREAARAVGDRFLNSWSIGLDSVARELVSPMAIAFAPDVALFRKRLAQRPDDGICPVPRGAAVGLRPLEGVTEWELEFLASYALSTNQLTNPGGSANRAPRGFAKGFAKRGDLAAFQYTANGSTYLMLLVRQQGKWQVLEPALPM